jgi:hypothetical protein
LNERLNDGGHVLVQYIRILSVDVRRPRQDVILGEVPKFDSIFFTTGIYCIGTCWFISLLKISLAWMISRMKISLPSGRPVDTLIKFELFL